MFWSYDLDLLESRDIVGPLFNLDEILQSC